jgi:hypothetical protein
MNWCRASRLHCGSLRERYVRVKGRVRLAASAISLGERADSPRAQSRLRTIWNVNNLSVFDRNVFKTPGPLKHGVETGSRA